MLIGWKNQHQRRMLKRNFLNQLSIILSCLFCRIRFQVWKSSSWDGKIINAYKFGFKMLHIRWSNWKIQTSWDEGFDVGDESLSRSPARKTFYLELDFRAVIDDTKKIQRRNKIKLRKSLAVLQRKEEYFLNPKRISLTNKRLKLWMSG